MQIEFVIKENRKRDPADIAAQAVALVIGILLLGLLSGMIVWRLNHPQPKEPPRELTQGERTSQALALAGVAAAGNSSTAIYTPLLLGAAANAKEQEGDNTNDTH